eukprot:CAMPEP_0182809598 /NCGR_PEP_ID=MMETSP0006_2-20121128/7270_1 /TAXON_ID=97485 /ORGANISM="Prymnesium parvum, Strain Texoma1" /LENGTH=109 /DNA_ID=CAMNT_0024935395 /DNA_START=259 /DNA_END=584 /DNA_ORIENTATION=+
MALADAVLLCNPEVRSQHVPPARQVSAQACGNTGATENARYEFLWRAIALAEMAVSVALPAALVHASWRSEARCPRVRNDSAPQSGSDLDESAYIGDASEETAEALHFR